MADLNQLQTELGVTFQDMEYLAAALIHRSYAHEQRQPGSVSNERLEFLGDSILAFVSADLLFTRYPRLTEGNLTDLRAALVRTRTLADFARRLQVGRYIKMSRGEQATGGRNRDAILACTFEAIIGALYLDSGLEPVRTFVIPLLEAEASHVLKARLLKDDKSLLQELAQAQLSLTPAYRVISETGPSHNREFTVEVVLGEQVFGQGQGKSKQSAEQEAAHQALDRWQSLALP